MNPASLCSRHRNTLPTGRHLLTLLLPVALLVGCVTSLPEPGLSAQGIVSAAHPEAARAGAAILQMGGNAADAAVATGFAITVVEPSMNSIGGRALALLRTREGGVHTYDGMTEVPMSYRRPETPQADGYSVIATPGVVATLARIHQDLGSLPWKTLLEPAIRLAEEGFIVLPGEAARLATALPKYPAYSGLQAHFATADGTMIKPGDRLRQPDLANTLRILAEAGASAFYAGEIADAIVKDMARNGGYLTREDLARYRVRQGRYITASYRGYDIHAMAAPGGGGLVIKALNILENFELSEMDEASWAAVVNQALAISFNTMNTDYRESDLERLVSKAWARQEAKAISLSWPEPASVNRTTSSGSVASYRQADPGSLLEEPHHTTHFAAVDCHGMTVSMTQTIGPVLGSRIVTPGLGFVYATTMGSYLSAADESPGSRPRTTISPTLVTRDGRVGIHSGGCRRAAHCVRYSADYLSLCGSWLTLG